MPKEVKKEKDKKTQIKFFKCTECGDDLQKEVNKFCKKHEIVSINNHCETIFTGNKEIRDVCIMVVYRK